MNWSLHQAGAADAGPVRLRVVRTKARSAPASETGARSIWPGISLDQIARGDWLGRAVGTRAVSQCRESNCTCSTTFPAQSRDWVARSTSITLASHAQGHVALLDDARRRRPISNR